MSGVLRSSLGLRPASETHWRKTRLRGTREIPEVVFKPFLSSRTLFRVSQEAPWKPGARTCSVGSTAQPNQGHLSPRARRATARLQATVPTVQVLPRALRAVGSPESPSNHLLPGTKVRIPTLPPIYLEDLGRRSQCPRSQLPHL